ERRGAGRDVRLVPGQSRHARRRRDDPSRALEPAGPWAAQEAQLMTTDWDRMFDEVYLRTYAQLIPAANAPRDAQPVVELVGLEPGADLLDCPCGYGRHSIEFARLGLLVVGADRSEVLLAEAMRRAGDGAGPRWVHADYRELPFEDASFDCVTNLFS